MSPTDLDQERPAPPPRRRGRGRWERPTPSQARRGALVALVLVGALVAGLVVWHGLTTCAGGLDKIDGACVGVTDSGDFGDPELTAVMNRIAAQNRAVSATGAYSIGYLVPLELADHRTSLSTELRHELEGAAVAQDLANRRDGVKVRLLVANAGPDNVHWEPVVRTLREDVNEPNRLRAVVGLGTSVLPTEQAIGALTGSAPIAVISARLTADTLSTDPNQPRIEGFARVGPTNSDEGVAAAALLRDSGARHPLLISDRNQADAYVATLARAFGAAFGPTDTETFNGAQEAMAVAFDTVTLDLCQKGPDAVYFAGRDDALVEFLRSLAGRSCGGLRVPIYTGDDVSDVLGAVERKDPGVTAALAGNVSVTYTGLAHPDLSTKPGPDEPVDTAALAALTQTTDLGDGAAIMGHDAVQLAIAAMDRAAGRDRMTFDTGAVIQALYAVRGAAPLVGASGRISLNRCGNVEQKVFPVLTVSPDGRPSFLRATHGAVGGTGC